MWKDGGHGQRKNQSLSPNHRQGQGVKGQNEETKSKSQSTPEKNYAMCCSVVTKQTVPHHDAEHVITSEISNDSCIRSSNQNRAQHSTDK